ncbi:MAG: glycosyltransferase family 4 protein [Chloroflexota bacterium]
MLLSSTLSPTNGLQTIGAARRLGVPVVFRSIDILHELVPYPVLSPVTRWLERKIYSKVDLVLTISPRLSRYVTETGAPPERVKLLPLGVDTDIFRTMEEDAALRKQWGLGEGPVVEFIGTLFDFSGLDEFIRRFPEVLKRVPEARLLIVGDGPQRPRLEKEIAAAGLGGRVVITGFKPFEAMPRYINLAAVCINTFRITDATRDIFPTKVVQYLACGRPVVATPLPGMQAIVDGEGQGVVYAGAEDMVARVADLLESAEKRRELGRAAMEYARQTHGYDRIVKELETVLAELAGRGKAI